MVIRHYRAGGNPDCKVYLEGVGTLIPGDVARDAAPVIRRYKMEYVLMFLIAFGIVGSVESRVRSILKTHERQLSSAQAELAECNRKLDLLLRKHG